MFGSDFLDSIRVACPFTASVAPLGYVGGGGQPYCLWYSRNHTLAYSPAAEGSERRRLDETQTIGKRLVVELFWGVSIHFTAIPGANSIDFRSLGIAGDAKG